MKTNWKKLICLTLSLLMLLSVCVACAPKGEETPPPTENPAPSPSTDGAKNEKLAEKGTDVYLSVAEGDIVMAYVTYNGYHNPIEERIFPISEPDYFFIYSYEYNNDGLLSGMKAQACSLDEYCDLSPYFSVKYTLDGKTYASSSVYYGEDQEIEEDMFSTVEYYDNGTIKKWTISYGDNEDTMGFSMDETGRRTLVEEWDEEITYAYTGDARTPASATYGDGDMSLPITLTHTDGKLSKISVEDDDSGFFEYEISHTADGKSLAKSSYKAAESADATDYGKGVYEMTYTDKGVYASITYAYYEGEALQGKYAYAFEYNAQGQMIKQIETEYDETGAKEDSGMIEITYDAAGNRTKITSKNYNADGDLVTTETEEMEYNAAGKRTKRLTKCIDSEGTVIYHKLQEYEYDANNNRIKEVYKSFDPEGNVESHDESRYAYDANGDLVQTDYYDYDAQGNVQAHNSSAYAYEYYENGELKSYTEMTIDYQGTEIVNKRKSVMEFDENGMQTKETIYYYDNPDNRDEVTDTQVHNYQSVPA